MGARKHVRQDDAKALHRVSPTLLKSLAFAVHRKNLATECILGALEGANCSFDGAFQVHSAEPGQGCKRALFMVQGDGTYMRAENIKVSNMLDIVISFGDVLADFPRLANLAKPTAIPSLMFFVLRRHTQV